MADQQTNGNEFVMKATVLPEHQRLNFLPDHFGANMLVFESLVYAHANELIEGYSGGFWDYVVTNNSTCFMVPRGQDDYKISVHGNYFEGTLSAEATGIVITLFAMSHFLNSYKFTDPQLDRYHYLRDFAAEHPEGAAIFRAID